MGTLSRVIFDPDTTPPTVPGTVAATALSQTAIRITWTASTDTGGSGLAGYRVLRSTTSGGTYTQFAADLSPASLAIDDVSLTAGTTRFYRVYAIDGNGNLSTSSSIASATTQSASGGSNIGQVGTYAALNLSTFPVYSVDMSQADYRLFATQANPFPPDVQGGLAGTGSQQHVSSGWPLGGGAYCRITPPTTNQYERGINLANLHRNGTLGIQEFNLRVEIRYGPTIGTAYQPGNNGCKHALVQFTPTVGGAGSTSGRPVFFLQCTGVADGAQNRRLNTIAAAPASNTLPAFGNAVYDERGTDDNPPGTNTYYCNGPQAFYLIDQADAGTTYNGATMFRCGEVITVEYRFITVATAQYPRGLIAMRMTSSL